MILDTAEGVMLVTGIFLVTLGVVVGAMRRKSRSALALGAYCVGQGALVALWGTVPLAWDVPLPALWPVYLLAFAIYIPGILLLALLVGYLMVRFLRITGDDVLRAQVLERVNYRGQVVPTGAGVLVVIAGLAGEPGRPPSGPAGTRAQPGLPAARPARPSGAGRDGRPTRQAGRGAGCEVVGGTAHRRTRGPAGRRASRPANSGEDRA